MENSANPVNPERNGETAKSCSSPSGGGSGSKSVHKFMGGGKGTLLSITVPALYSRYEESVDRYYEMIHKRLSKHYKIVDENVISRLPRSLSKDKDT
ncbi:hypothetical protein EZV62_025892 [Acer yangbiense]|uniref:Reticulon domain-containing protein n=1 Tax=Acer yangbiense TaxID=1000413 RepID=A0A5C7GZR5_9ROSI|nr:hypothetical protein EZV62_025892 [Acer yangbiense]